jgi:hypothetical protein
MDMWTTTELLELLNDERVSPPVGFWSDMAIGSIQMTGENIQFDQLPKFDTRLAPFVSPLVEGRIMRNRTTQRSSVKPAYVKPKHEVRPDAALVIRRGEKSGGELTAEQRFELAVLDNLILEDEAIERRIDWMACRGIADGSVTISGEDYPTVVVDFQRNAALTVVNAGAALWSAVGTTATPVLDVARMRRRVMQFGKSAVGKVVFGQSAWAYFSADPSLKDQMSTQFRGAETDVDRSSGMLGSGVEFMGRVGSVQAGFYDCYVYTNDYEDDDGTVKPYIDTNDVVGVANPQLYLAFGTILDAAVMRAERKFPKMWTQQDPSVIYTMTQSAPMAIPVNPNGSFRLRAASTVSPNV